MSLYREYTHLFSGNFFFGNPIFKVDFASSSHKCVQLVIHDRYEENVCVTHRVDDKFHNK